MRQRLLQQQFALLASMAQLMIKVTLLISLLAIAACKKTPHLKAEAIAGYLHTPWGEFKFKNVKQENYNHMRLPYGSYNNRKFPLYLKADAGDIIVVYGGGSLLVYNPIFHEKYGGSAPITINSDATYISSHDDKVVAKFLPKDIKKLRRNRYVKNFINDQGENEIRIRYDKKFTNDKRVDFVGFKFPPESIRTSQFGNPYKIFIPFNLGGDDFLVDITVKHKTTYTYDIDIAPAIPH